MLHATKAFHDAIRSSHKMVAKCTVARNNIQIADLVVTDGTVTVDANNVYRRTIQVTIIDPDGTMTPSSPSDMLHPSTGNEIWAFRGIEFPNGTQELVCLGKFIITDFEVDDSGQSKTITIKGSDRGIKIARSKLTQPYVISPGITMGQVIQDLMIQAWSGVSFYGSFPTLLPVIPPVASLNKGDDPWATCIKWARDTGYDLYFGTEGYALLRKLSESDYAAETPVWTFSEGDDATILSLRRDQTGDDTYSHVVVTGEPTDGSPGVWAEAKDLDPNSPTYVNGPFGDVVYFYSSPLIKTADQAQSVANSMLSQHKGYSDHLHFNFIVHPCLDVNDIVKVERAASKLNDTRRLTKLSIPLVAIRAMEADTQVRYIS